MPPREEVVIDGAAARRALARAPGSPDNNGAGDEDSPCDGNRRVNVTSAPQAAEPCGIPSQSACVPWWSDAQS